MLWLLVWLSVIGIRLNRRPFFDCCIDDLKHLDGFVFEVDDLPPAVVHPAPLVRNNSDWQIVVLAVANQFGYFIWPIHLEVVEVGSRHTVIHFILALSDSVLSKKGAVGTLLLTF